MTDFPYGSVVIAKDAERDYLYTAVFGNMIMSNNVVSDTLDVLKDSGVTPDDPTDIEFQPNLPTANQIDDILQKNNTNLS